MQKFSAIGSEFRTLRKKSGLTSSDLAEKIGCAQSTISKIENGKLKPTIELTESFVKAINASEEDARKFIEKTHSFLLEFDKWQTAKNAESSSKTHDYWFLEKDESEPQSSFLKKETDSSYIRSFQWHLIPGLLQSRLYVNEVVNRILYLKSGNIDKSVEMRMQRQSLLKDNKKNFEFIFTEMALRSCLFCSEVAREQIGVIRKAASYPNVNVRILPIGIFPSLIPMDSFVIYDTRLVTIETLSREVRIWADREIEEYVRVFNSLVKDSVENEELESLLSEVEKELAQQ